MSAVPYGRIPPRYRLPDATRVGRVTLQVADLGRSIAYYTQVLGLRVLSRSVGAAGLGPHGHDEDVPLVELRERHGARRVPRHGLLGLYHFALLVPDRPALGRLLAHLLSTGVRPGMSDHRVSEALYLTDPDGLGIEVYVDRPRAEWRHEGRQLMMATDPLDADAVIGAARGAAWTGMPKGTVVGHVHLFVGDLAEAASFYHAAIGLDQTNWSYPGALFMAAGGYHHHLGTNTWAADAPRASDADARLIEWELVVPDASAVGAIGDSLRTEGRVVRIAPDGLRADDPWGTTLKISAPDIARGPV
jgi:catechol 2,3-dioxygenase